MTTSRPGRRAPRARTPRSATTSIAQILLSFEFLVVVLCALALFGLRSLPPAVALGGGGAVLLLIVIAAGLARTRVGIALGWVVQVVLLATFAVNVGVGVAGLIFAAIWTYGMITGRRVDRRTAA